MARIPFSVFDFFGYLASGFVVLTVVDYCFQLGISLGAGAEIWDGFLVVVLMYVVGHLVAGLSTAILENALLRRRTGAPEELLLREAGTDRRGVLGIERLFRPMPEETRGRILARARTDGFQGAGRALFVHCHSLAIRNPVVAERLAVFANVYVFCRNMSMATILALPLLAGRAIVGFRHAWLWFGASVLVAAGMFVRFLKFYRHFTEEVLREYAIGEDRAGTLSEARRR